MTSWWMINLTVQLPIYPASLFSLHLDEISQWLCSGTSMCVCVSVYMLYMLVFKVSAHFCFKIIITSLSANNMTHFPPHLNPVSNPLLLACATEAISPHISPRHADSRLIFPTPQLCYQIVSDTRLCHAPIQSRSNEDKLPPEPPWILTAWNKMAALKWEDREVSSPCPFSYYCDLSKWLFCYCNCMLWPTGT